MAVRDLQLRDLDLSNFVVFSAVALKDSLNLEVFPSPSPFNPRLSFGSLYSHFLTLSLFAMLSGSYIVGGILAVRASLHPLSTMKTRLQVSDQKYKGLFDVFRRTIASEGVSGLYRGFGVAMIGVLPAQTLYITSLEGSKLLYNSGFGRLNQTIQERRSLPQEERQWFDPYLKHMEMSPAMIATVTGFLSGATSSCSAAIAGVPADIISQRQMIRTDKSNVNGNQYRDSLAMIKEIYANNGVRGFYRGYFATIITYAPSSAIWWATYSASRRALVPWASDSSWKQVVLPALCGISAAVTAASVTNPLDVAKTRLQIARHKIAPVSQAGTAVASAEVAPTTIGGVLKDIYQREGLVKLWTKGLTARAANMSLFAVMMSSAYEGIKYMSKKSEEALYEVE